MTLTKTFEFSTSEQKWYDYWMEKGYFHSQPDHRPSYTIVIPPPNVTGVLHMGHALNNTVQDILIRRAKLSGYNTCWVPGTDHASIATEAKVVNMLKEKGIDKNDLSRDEFLKYAWEWKEKYGGVILQQLKKLGCSLDWDRTAFTMDDDYYKAVLEVFVDLYKKGQIYRGVKMINWDPQALTALSDEEVIFKKNQGQLYYIKYQIAGSDETITVATVRPETIMGDTAVCIHPEDPRFAHLKGKKAIIPLINKEIPIIEDDYIDLEFGTGALKVTPAHDLNDYELGQKHNLEVVDILNDDGTLNDNAQIYIGEDRFAVRKKIVKELEEKGHLEKVEQYSNQVGVSERTGAVIEPKLSMQWWCKVDDMSKKALAAVMENEIEFFPARYKNLYNHWMTNIKDWNISRQLWWGQRIPAWYDANNKIYVGVTADEALSEYQKVNPDGKIEDLRQDADVLDTWFSSWLWPMKTLGWNMNGSSEEFKYYYPTQTLVTGPDIIFFWVARMVMAGYNYLDQKPFEKVYFTGIIRDKQGRKMSKQLGNSPDLLQLIADHGADAVRFSVLIASPAGNDIFYDEAYIEQGKHFINKIWNALKLIQIWKDKVDESDNTVSFAGQWLQNHIAKSEQDINQLFVDFKLSEALKTTYSLIWDDFCSWYLEWVKPPFEGKISRGDYDNTIALLKRLMTLLHPFMPFITTEIYDIINENANENILDQQNLLEEKTIDNNILTQGNYLKEFLTKGREWRQQKGLKPKEALDLYFEAANAAQIELYNDVLKKQLNISVLDAVETVDDKSQLTQIIVTNDTYYFKCDIEVNVEEERKKLTDELNYTKGFLTSVEKKLSNEKFMANAKPEVIDAELKKKEDAEAKIKAIEDSLAALS